MIKHYEYQFKYDEIDVNILVDITQNEENMILLCKDYIKMKFDVSSNIIYIGKDLITDGKLCYKKYYSSLIFNGEIFEDQTFCGNPGVIGYYSPISIPILSLTNYYYDFNINKIYIGEEFDTFFYINKIFVNKKHFITLAEWRDKQINSILDDNNCG